eukprot:c1197_g1_i1.p1 GENE.c1197_g1_i1~~c1197_g1_i1.p1  ORF type:complete len:459 (-),score=109.09 c1197_g1_i1:291-1667(-)
MEQQQQQHFLNLRSVEEDFEIQELIGSGSYASVFRGINKKTNEVVAIKRINKLRLLWSATRKNKIDLMAEVEVMKRLKHPYIIQLFSVYDTSKELALVMEYGEGGELIKRVEEAGKYTEQNAREVVKRILQAIAYMHNQGTVHRDVKPENLVLMTKGSSVDVKLADFGLSKLSIQSMRTFVGTPHYLAPEMLKGDEYGKEVDIWAIGVVTFQMLTGCIPFVGETPDLLYSAIMAGAMNISDSKWGEVSEEGHDFVQKLLRLNPIQRLTIAQALEHPWIQGRKFPAQVPLFTLSTSNLSINDPCLIHIDGASSPHSPKLGRVGMNGGETSSSIAPLPALDSFDGDCLSPTHPISPPLSPISQSRCLAPPHSPLPTHLKASPRTATFTRSSTTYHKWLIFGHRESSPSSSPPSSPSISHFKLGFARRRRASTPEVSTTSSTQSVLTLPPTTKSQAVFVLI